MIKTQINAEIVADSINPQGDRLTSLLITFPRILLSEINTHRMLSKNTSSSRAIPFNKMVEAVQNDPFIPIAWQKHHSGMQGNEYFTDEKDIYRVEQVWRDARRRAIDVAKDLHSSKVTKQLCNRLLEPFMWTTMLITGSREGWDNFFHLRNPVYETEIGVFKSKRDALISYAEGGVMTNLPTTDLEWLQINKGQAEIHIMDLAEKIWNAVNESEPKQLQAGEWHIPFRDKMDYGLVGDISHNRNDDNHIQKLMVKISTAMAARTSYTVVGDEKEVDYSKMIELHDRLIAQDPPHSSPLEHCARAMSDEEYVSFIKGTPDVIDYEKDEIAISYLKTYEDAPESGWCGPYKGFISYRHFIDNKLKI